MGNFSVDITWVVNDYGTLRRDKFEVNSFSEIDELLKKEKLCCLDEILVCLSPSHNRSTLSDSIIKV